LAQRMEQVPHYSVSARRHGHVMYAGAGFTGRRKRGIQRAR
jgi:hypothetical protein